MWYVVSESGDLQSTASHEGSCDVESTKESVDTEATSAAGGKGIKAIASELVTVAIQNAVIRLQNEVRELICKLCEIIRMPIHQASEGDDLESTVSMETKEIPVNVSVVGSSLAGVTGLGSLQFSDILQKDAFLVFRSLCKLSMKNISNETDPR